MNYEMRMLHARDSSHSGENRPAQKFQTEQKSRC